MGGFPILLLPAFCFVSILDSSKRTTGGGGEGCLYQLG